MMDRREWLGASAIGGLAIPTMGRTREIGGIAQARQAFAQTDVAYLDNGSQHPISLAAKAATDRYYERRMTQTGMCPFNPQADEVRAKFARLTNADPDEIALVPSTTAGEQMVLRALDLPSPGARIVTDTLHFFGSIPLYEEMGKRGCEVAWVQQVQGRIRLADMKAAIRPGTRLVALSLVSTYNGFEHDLKAVCDMAHAVGARVYADIVHAAGCVPVDLHGSGVDFAATASYKWLMGDFGLGFLFVRKDVLPTLTRQAFGYYGLASLDTHTQPFDKPGDRVADYAFRDDAMGAFGVGTIAYGVVAQLNHSLDVIGAIGVPAIQAHAQSLTDVLKRELPRRGYMLLTPPESRAPIVACAMEGADKKLSKPMMDAKVKLTLEPNRFRLTPSIQNSMADIDRFLSALPRA